MKRKIVSLILLLMLITGCSVEYNLTIDAEGNFSENFIVEKYANETENLEDIYYEYLEEYPIYIDEEFMYYDPYSKNENYTYYLKSYQKLNNGYLFSYKANLTKDNYKRARSINTIFNTISIGYLEDEDYYYLSLKSPTKVLLDNEIEKLVINITFDNLVVLSSNATYVSGNKYTWTFTNFTDASINVKYQYKDSGNLTNECNITCSDREELINPNSKDCYCKIVENNTNEEKETSYLDYILLGAVLLLFIVIIIGLIKYKSINKDQN